MSSLQVFAFESQEIRMTVIDGNPWWVASDVCLVLEHSDTSKAVSRLDDDEKLSRTMFVSGQNREILLVNEPGLYSLVLTSRKPQAKPFKRWLTHEVLPSIRKTGSYSIPQKEQLPSRVLAVETARSIREITDSLEDNPRLAQLLTDIAMNDALALVGSKGVNVSPLRGVAEIAQDMGYLVTTSNRVNLGKFVRSQLDTGVQEKRLCNGTQRQIWCYPDCAETREVIKRFFE